mgnify:FL=1
MAKAVVLGVGNILLSDEGFGVRVAEALSQRFRFPDAVEVLDGGTLGIELMRFLDGAERLILIDAIHGSEPGSFRIIQGDDVRLYFQEKVSLHEMGIQEVLASLVVMEKPIAEIVVIGVVPQSLEISLDLTPLVASRIDEATDSVIRQLHDWGLECSAR